MCKLHPDVINFNCSICISEFVCSLDGDSIYVLEPEDYNIHDGDNDD